VRRKYDQRRSSATVSKRQACCRGGGSGSGYAGHNFKRNSRPPQSIEFFAQAAKNPRVSGLEPDDGFALPFAGVAVAIERDGDGLQVERELEGGLRERLAVQLPAVVSVQTGINSPRYVNFRQLKAAEATEIDVRGADDAPGASGWRMAEPEAGEGAEMLAGRAPEVAERILALVAERRS